MFPVGSGRMCIGIVILDDLIFEGNESFQLIIEELGISTDIIILEDDNGSAKINFVAIVF